MAWSSAWGNKKTKGKNTACYPKSAANWKIATKQFSVQYMQFHWHFCHWKKSECFMSSLSELFCFELTIPLHLVWLPVFYKNLDQNESEWCCWNKIVREWPNGQLLLVISREIPTFGAFSSLFSMFFLKCRNVPVTFEFLSTLSLRFLRLCPKVPNPKEIGFRNSFFSALISGMPRQNLWRSVMILSVLTFKFFDHRDFWKARDWMSPMMWSGPETCRKIGLSYRITE